MSLGLLWKAEFLWEKNNYNAKYTAWGSWKSPSMPYIKYTWEFIEVFDKETHKKTGRREDIDITADEFKEWVLGQVVISPGDPDEGLSITRPCFPKNCPGGS